MTPTQADREFAVEMQGSIMAKEFRQAVLEGRQDTWRPVQQAMTFRLAAEAAAFEKAAGVALREVRDEGNGAAVKANAGIIYQGIRKLAGEKHD